MAAENIGKPYKVSNSEIQNFKDCRRKWYFQHYRDLMPKKIKVNGPLALGTRVHAALEVFYRDGRDLIEAYNEFLDDDVAIAEAEWLDVDAVKSEGEMGRIMLEGYLDWIADEGIDAEYDMISNEETLEMPMLDGKVILRGKLDQRVRRKSDGTRLIRDFKTVGQSFEQFTKILHLNEQILTYMVLEAYHNTEEDRSDGVEFIMLKKNKRTAAAKPPFYAREEILHNEYTLRNFWTSLHAVVSELYAVKEALDAGADHRQVAWKRASQDCTWKCPYFSICGMVDDGSAVEEAIADYYEVGNPDERYDEKKGTE